jgi:hypothetical protein
MTEERKGPRIIARKQFRNRPGGRRKSAQRFFIEPRLPEGSRIAAISISGAAAAARGAKALALAPA